MKKSIHVTANEAGRNAVMQSRLLKILDILIDAINSGASKEELVECIFSLKKYLVRNMKIRPTIGD